MIRFILTSIYSKRDINGNCYWMANVTSTKTGKSLLFTTPHSSNARASIRQNGIEWEHIHETMDVELPIRDFNRKEKYATMRDSCQDKEVIQAIKDLEK